MTNPAEKANFTDLNSLFFGDSATSKDIDATKEQTIEVNLSDLHSFKNHPYKVLENEEMEKLVESIKERGVLFPALVRRRIKGGYELISGHRRKRACELAGLTTMPVIIRELTDDEATIIMVDSNIQREEILPSEKAKAYKMKYEALKHQGKSNVHGSSLEQMSEESEESRATIQRYIKTADLNNNWMNMLDDKKIGIKQGVELAFLSDEEQDQLYDLVSEISTIPNHAQSVEIKKMSQNDVFDLENIRTVLLDKPVKKKNLVIKEEKIRKYFTPDYSNEQIIDVIMNLLDEWNKKKTTSNELRNE